MSEKKCLYSSDLVHNSVTNISTTKCDTKCDKTNTYTGQEIPYDSAAYSALRIVLINHIQPSIQFRRKNIIKIQRWWRRIGGAYYGFELIKPIKATFPYTPPSLWRQVGHCISQVSDTAYEKFGYSRCKKVKLRRCQAVEHAKTEVTHIIEWLKDFYKKHPMEYFPPEDLFHATFSQDDIEKYYQSCEYTYCRCGDKPSWVIIDYCTRHNLIEYVFRELAGDNLDSQTRARVSRFVTERLRPRV